MILTDKRSFDSEVCIWVVRYWTVMRSQHSIGGVLWVVWNEMLSFLVRHSLVQIHWETALWLVEIMILGPRVHHSVVITDVFNFKRLRGSKVNSSGVLKQLIPVLEAPRILRKQNSKMFWQDTVVVWLLLLFVPSWIVDICRDYLLPI